MPDIATWPQLYDPFGNRILSTAVSALPVVTLFFVLVALKKRVWISARCLLVGERAARDRKIVELPAVVFVFWRHDLEAPGIVRVHPVAARTLDHVVDES